MDIIDISQSIPYKRRYVTLAVLVNARHSPDSSAWDPAPQKRCPNYKNARRSTSSSASARVPMIKTSHGHTPFTSARLRVKCALFLGEFNQKCGVDKYRQKFAIRKSVWRESPWYKRSDRPTDGWFMVASHQHTSTCGWGRCAASAHLFCLEDRRTEGQAALDVNCVLGSTVTLTVWGLRSALFWVATQRVVVNPYRRFGKTYRSHL